MRDILLTLFIAVLLPFVIRRPEIGAYLWVWLGMMNPHKLSYGFASTLPFAQIVAILTMVGYVFTKHKKPLPINGGTLLLFALIVWMTVTSIYAINDPQLVWGRWLFVMKINVMLLLTMMVLRGRKQIDWLVWVIVVSIGFFGVKGGFWTLTTGGGGRVWGPPGGMLEDNNSLAVALVMILPLMYYLQQTATRRWLRRSLLGAMVLVGFSVLGSQSRGALVAVLGMSFALGLKSKRPVQSSLILAAVVMLALAFMPDSWTQRMDTIQDYGGENSAMSRIYTWHTLWNVALSHPLVGAGFAADNLSVFTLFAPTDSRFDLFQGRVYVAHSIYFQALGEHGFPGLLLFTSLWIWIWWAAGRVAKQSEEFSELASWAPILMRMCQVSALGFGMGGAFLSLMNLDVPYYILVIVILTRCALEEVKRSKSQATGSNQPFPSTAKDKKNVALGYPSA